MTTILPIGTTVCIACRTPVAIVRRTAAVPCRCTVIDVNLFGHTEYECGDLIHLCQHEPHAIPDVAWTVVEASGERHLCAVGT